MIYNCQVAALPCGCAQVFGQADVDQEHHGEKCAWAGGVLHAFRRAAECSWAGNCSGSYVGRIRAVILLLAWSDWVGRLQRSDPAVTERNA